MHAGFGGAALVTLARCTYAVGSCDVCHGKEKKWEQLDAVDVTMRSSILLSTRFKHTEESVAPSVKRTIDVWDTSPEGFYSENF